NAYSMALRDCESNTFEAQKYQDELNTTKNRGFTDAYLIHKPFEKHDTQNYDYALSAGSYEVTGFILENENYFMCKYKVYPNDEIEIFAPLNSTIVEVDNEIGSIYKKNDEKYYISFKKIVTELGKEMESVHSGNTNPIKLPGKLPYMTMLRTKSDLPNTETSCS
ncbi:MAG: collagenase-like protease, partial [Epsilonproteobacteria bacterium]